MSYLALARKWRPSQFNQVVGQAHVLTALENALNQNKLHHAYLFSGTRGVGKTSIGRLFAKGLNCETGITATPCGVCDACREIDEGRFVDLLEIDAASRTKVEDTRELLDNVQYKPARARFKVYLIDEVHMLSRHSFNALLKTLEEPPEYVKFLLATTDPQKLPVTILSRCLQFHLKPISVDNIHEQLSYILGQESVTAEERALGMIAHAADGSMRDALSLTDQAIALGNGSVIGQIVSGMLGTLDADQAIHLLEAIASKKTGNAMLAVEKLAQNGVDWDSLLQELSAQLHRIAMYQALPASLDKSKPDAEKIELLSQYISPQDVQLYYEIALKGRKDLPLAPTQRMGLEMSVLRMMAFRPVRTDSASAIELPGAEAATATADTAPKPAPVQEQVQEPVQTPVRSVEEKSAVDTVQKHQETSSKTEPMPEQSSTIPEQTSAIPAQPEVRDTPAETQSDVQVQDNKQVPEPDYQAEELPPLPAEEDYPPVPDEYIQEMYPESAPNPAQEAAAKPNQNTTGQPAQNRSEPAATEKPASPLTGLRHQLRSRRQQANRPAANRGTGGKKPEAAPAESVLERVAQQHSVTKMVSQDSSFVSPEKADNAKENEPYQWKPTRVLEETEKSELTPTQIRQALEHTKTPEMMQKLLEESVAQDNWAALIQTLDIPKLVEQLALNSSYRKDGQTIELVLRPSQAHLNTDKAQKELLGELNRVLGEECVLTVVNGETGQTPLELREAIYQNKLQAAHQVLQEDSNVQFIQTRFAAELDSDSVRPI